MSARSIRQAASPPALGRVLAIHPGALGDVLQAVPALRALGGAAHVTFCGQPRLGALLAGAGVAGESLSFDGLRLEVLFTDEPAGPEVRERLRGFDEVVSWFGARDERYPARLRALSRQCVVAAPVPAADSRSTVWQHLLQSLGRAGEPRREPLAVPDEWRAAAREVLAPLAFGASGPLLLVHPGAGGRSKLIPPETLAAVVDGLGRRAPLRVLVHEGPADREAAERLLRLLQTPALRVTDPTLPSLAAIASGADAYLGGDSGVSHLAAPVGAPAVLLFPAATRERWRPWSPTARLIGLDDPDAGPAAARALADLLRA
jgi:ADP-heptose:LPS heptosyltransferase